ncbi:class I ribonucleotide reductase maintenance protein YfaE [Thiopseudomonas denitrificans]|nr:class I ribonucleotide reductase maintenance protein YfaE [Thiopseudomonas denitrificans]
MTEDMVFELEGNETLLDALERTGHHVEYQCRSGYCGACRIPLKAGSVEYAKPPLALLRRGEILPCCCTVNEPLKLKVHLRSKLAG